MGAKHNYADVVDARGRNEKCWYNDFEILQPYNFYHDTHSRGDLEVEGFRA